MGIDNDIFIDEFGNKYWFNWNKKKWYRRKKCVKDTLKACPSFVKHNHSNVVP